MWASSEPKIRLRETRLMLELYNTDSTTSFIYGTRIINYASKRPVENTHCLECDQLLHFKSLSRLFGRVVLQSRFTQKDRFRFPSPQKMKTFYTGLTDMQKSVAHPTKQKKV